MIDEFINRQVAVMHDKLFKLWRSKYQMKCKGMYSFDKKRFQYNVVLILLFFLLFGGVNEMLLSNDILSETEKFDIGEDQEYSYKYADGINFKIRNESHLDKNTLTLVNGEPIRVGTNDGVGDFVVPSIQSSPIGTINLFGGERSDIFVVADRWNPGLYIYQWKGDNDSGTPIFSQPISIEAPFEQAKIEPGYIFEDENGNIYGLWLKEQNLIAAQFDRKNLRFGIMAETEIKHLPLDPYRLTSRMLEDGQIEVYLSIPDGSSFRAPGDHRGKEYRPFDGSGIWMGPKRRDGVYRFSTSWPDLPKSVDAEQVLPIDEGGLFGIFSLGIIQPEELSAGKLLYGILLGGVFDLQGATTDSLMHVEKKPVLSNKGVAIRHPAVWMNMVVYPALDGSKVDLIAGGEGGMFYYEFQGLDNEKKLQPIYKEPREVQQESAQLYKGSLIVPNVVDWNGNGILDIVGGNAAGDLVYFKNHGSNEAPEFAPAVHLESGGEPVLIKGGYRGSIQGPPEAHWGYTSPTVVVMNDARGMHTVYLNKGTITDPELSLPKSLYMESLHFAGTWRTRPAAGLLEGRMAYITLDTDDDVHLYWQHDKYNLEDGGKLRLKDGTTINANFLHAGGKGRAKFELVDWDGNGKIDLLIGTPRHATFPEPERGVPWSMNQAGAAVLLLRNVGTNFQPVYEYPAVMHFKGEPMHFGQHACSPTATTLGGGGLNIIVGTETGEMIFFRGDDISFIQPKR